MARKVEVIDVIQAEFSNLTDQAIYDGIWANFSLLHEERSKFPGHLSRVATALKPNGIFHLGMKTGSGERRDHLERYYTFYSAAELRQNLEAAGFQVLQETTGEGTGLAGTVDPWIEIISHAIKKT